MWEQLECVDYHNIIFLTIIDIVVSIGRKKKYEWNKIYVTTSQFFAQYVITTIVNETLITKFKYFWACLNLNFNVKKIIYAYNINYYIGYQARSYPSVFFNNEVTKNFFLEFSNIIKYHIFKFLKFVYFWEISCEELPFSKKKKKQ